MSMTKTEATDAGRATGYKFFAASPDVAALLASRTARPTVYEVVRQNASVLTSAAMADARTRSNATYNFFFDAFVNAAMAEWQRAYDELPEVKAEKRARRVREKIEAMKNNATADLERFTTEFAKNPLNAFEWIGGRAILAAATLEATTRLLYILDREPGTGAYPDESAVDAALGFALEQAVRGARWPSKSTDPIVNLAKESTATAYAEVAASYHEELLPKGPGSRGRV